MYKWATSYGGAQCGKKTLTPRKILDLIFATNNKIKKN